MSNRTAALYASKSAVWVAIASLVVALLLPILTTTQQANAAQLLERFVHMESSATGVETTYYVEFQIPDTATVGSFRVEFCDENPLPGLDCTVSTSSGVNVPDLDASAGSAITVTGVQFGTASAAATPDTPGTDNTGSCTTPTLQTVNAGDTHFDVHCNVAETISAATNDYLWLQVDNPNNPTNAVNDTFYARLYTFSATTASAYVATAPPLGNYEGGVALSTAEQITVSARVQEVLTFTVGVDDEADNCAVIAGSAVDLGVLTTTQTNQASVNGVAATPNTDVACAEVTTNAANGVGVFYVGDNLAVGNTVCADADTDKGTNDVLTDQCINRAADGTVATGTPITDGDEQWGLGIVDAPHQVGTSTTTNMTVETAYDALTNDEWSFVPNSVTRIASSTTVVDQEAIEIDMAATPSITTPTGVYDTTLTFIATATF